MEAVKRIDRFSLVVFVLTNIFAIVIWFGTNTPLEILTNPLLLSPLALVVCEIGFAVYRQQKPRVLEQIRISDVRPTQAGGIVDDYLSGFEETEFGFPTGFFQRSQSDDPNTYVYREQTLSTRGVELAVSVCVNSVRAGLAAIVSRLQSGIWILTALVMGFIVSGFLTFFFFFPLWIAVGGEAILKKFLASKITARVVEAPDQKNDSLVTIELRGMSAIRAEKHIVRAFESPRRPELATS
jgi:hypothetical protein